MLPKFFELVKRYQTDIVLAVAIILIAVTSYNIGKIIAYRSIKTPITITEPQDIVRREVGQGSNQAANIQSAASPRDLRDLTVVASKKSSSKLYHFTWCPGAKQIAVANKLTFTTESAAITAGYTLAGNCRK